MNRLFSFVILSFVLVIFSGCDKEKEPVPSYLHIKKFSFTTSPGQGLNTSDITDAKVFANGAEVGTFELPVTIPIIATGDVEITLIPNIRENGSSSYHLSYKPYQSFTKTINMKELRVDTISPSTSYRSNTTFAWQEDFESPGIKMLRYGLNNTNDSLQRISTSTPGVNQPFSGSDYCALINIAPRDTGVDFERCSNEGSGWVTLPTYGTDVYVEMDYKSNVNIQVGMYIDNGTTIQQAPVLFTYPSETWRKIYINLKSELSDIAIGSKIRVFFGVYKSRGDSTTHPVVYLDNLKLVYVQ